MYCLNCEKEINVLWPTNGPFGASFPIHVIDYIDREFGNSWKDCNGPFVSCPPPEQDIDYWEWLFTQEPDDEWLTITSWN